ncbi:MAG: hypothetical protein PHX83_02710 [Acidobacteriia bacterium]|nr:hypothetical protein [Terriglobia bacterium]
MTAWEIFHQGRYFARRNKKVWFLLWLMNGLMASIAAWPVFNALNSDLSHSLMAAPMMDRFSIDFAAEFLFKHQDSLPALVSVLTVVSVVYLILTLLTTGGTLAVFSSADRRFNAPLFFRGCSVYFWRFFRLFLVSLIFYGVLVAGLNAALSGVVGKVTAGWTVEKYVRFTSWSRVLIVVFVFVLINMIFDYAKVRLVITEGRSAIMAALRSIKFVFKNFRKTLAVYIYCALLLLILALIYNPLEQALPQYTRRWVVLVFLLGQIFILARVFVRLTFFSSEVLLYESLATPNAISTPVEPATPPAADPTPPGERTSEEPSSPAAAPSLDITR